MIKRILKIIGIIFLLSIILTNEKDLKVYAESITNEIELNEEITASNDSNSDEEYFISGTIYWTTIGGSELPLRFSKIKLVEKSGTTNVNQYITYTNEAGEYYIQLDDSIDLSNTFELYCYAFGKNVQVIDLTSNEDVCFLITTENIFNNHINTLLSYSRNITISQSVTMAAQYYKEMKNLFNDTDEEYDIDDVNVMINSSVDNCCYRSSNKTIYLEIEEDMYEDIDVILHEYGHHIAHCENLSDSFGGGHVMTKAMGQHYYEHFNTLLFDICWFGCSIFENPDLFSEEECKSAGIKLAWSEGLASYFSKVIEEYYDEFFSNFANSNDDVYSTSNLRYEEMNDSTEQTEDCEYIITLLLYDMYDPANEEHDQIALGNEAMWDYIVNSGAVYFDQFDDYFIEYCENRGELTKYCKLLHYYNLSPQLLPYTINTTFSECSLSFNWLPYDENFAFTNYSYKVVFMDENYDCIMTSEEYSTKSIVINDQLWDQMLFYDVKYISVAVIENTYPVTEYESEFYRIDVPEPSILYYMTNYTFNFDEKYEWFKFTAPYSANYLFTSFGDNDLTGELFSRINAGALINSRISFSDNIDETNLNFQLNYYLNEGETIYLRVSYKEDSTGASVKVTSVEHFHDYTYSYVHHSKTQHYAYCACGEYISENHQWYWDVNRNRCEKCGYVSLGPVIIRPFNEEEEEYE